MKKFDWNEFTRDDIAVHCKTQKEAIDFCNMMHKRGLKWRNGDFLIENSKWDNYKEETCYTASVCFYPKTWYKKKGYKLLEFSDFDFTYVEHDIILNVDIYREEIEKLNYAFKVAKSTYKIKPCDGCEDCIFDDKYDLCKHKVVRWLLSPYEPLENTSTVDKVVTNFLKHVGGRK